MLEREYTSSTPHNAISKAAEDSSVLRAENYQELVNALLYFVVSGDELGTVRLYNYPQDEAEADLAAACTEVIEEDPLGAYSVEDIRYNFSTIVAYDEAHVEIDYRRSRQQVADIHTVTGTSAIRNEIREILEYFNDKIVLKTNYFTGDIDQIETLIRQAYYETIDSAQGMPIATIQLYPETGVQRIIEITFEYPMEKSQLIYRRDQLNRKATELLERLSVNEADALLLSLGTSIIAQGGLQPEGGSTAYHALLAGGSDSQGLALAMALLCEKMNMHCIVVEGTLNEIPHHWNMVTTPWGYRHLDISAYDETVWDNAEHPPDSIFMSDQTATDMGYLWDTQWVPLAGQQIED